MSEDINTLLNKIKLYNSNSNFYEAYNLLSSCIKNITDNSSLKNEFILEMGQCLCGMGKNKEAKKYFEDVIKFDSQNIYALEGLLKVADIDNDYDFIIETAKKLKKLEYIDLYFDKLIKKMSSYSKIGLKDEFMKLYNSLHKVYDLFDKKKQNIILNEYEILNKAVILKSKPRFLHIVVTNRCNLKCVMCVQDKRVWELSKKNYDEILELIQYAEQIAWQGGEVFLYKNFLTLFKEAIKNNCHQSIITNGLLLSPKFMELSVQNKVCLTISIDAVEKELYESIRLGSSFEKLILNLNFIKTIRTKYKKNKAFSLKMSVVVMKQNVKCLNDIINFAIEYNFDEITFFACQAYDENSKCKLDNIETQLAFDTIERMKKNDRINNLIRIESNIVSPFVISEVKQKDNIQIFDNKNQKDKDQNNNIKDNNSQKELLCYAPWKRLYIGESGIKPECQCRTYNIDLDCEDLWNSESMQKFRQCMIFEKQDINNDIKKYCETFCMNTGEVGKYLRE